MPISARRCALPLICTVLIAAVKALECSYPAIYPTEPASVRLLHDPRKEGEAACENSKFRFNSTAVDQCRIQDNTNFVRLDDEVSSNVFDVKVRHAQSSLVRTADCWSLFASGTGPVMEARGLTPGQDYLVASISGHENKLALRLSTEGGEMEDTTVELLVTNRVIEEVACACAVVEQSSATSSCRLDSPALEAPGLLNEIARTVSRMGDRVQRDPAVTEELTAEGIYISRVVSRGNLLEVVGEFVSDNAQHCAEWKDAMERKGVSMGWSSIRMVGDSLTLEWVQTGAPAVSTSGSVVEWYIPVAVVLPIIVLATVIFLLVWKRKCSTASAQAETAERAERQAEAGDPIEVAHSEPARVTKSEEEMVRVVPTPSLARYARKVDSSPMRFPQAAASPQTVGSTSQGGLPLVPGPGWESTYDATEVNETLHSGTARGSLALQRGGSVAVVPPPCPTPQYKRKEVAPYIAGDYGTKQDRLEHWVATQKKEPSSEGGAGAVEDDASEYSQ